MLNLDQDQNNIDWCKKDAVIDDTSDPSVLTVDPYSTSDDQLRTKPLSHPSIEPVTPADAVDPVPAPSAQNPSPETPGDLLSAPNDDNESGSSLSPIPSHEDGTRLPSNSTSSLPTNDQALANPSALPVTGGDHAPTAASRQSTPLTDLSGPSSPTHAKIHEPDAAESAGKGGTGMMAQVGAAKGSQEGDEAEIKSDTAEDATVVAIDGIGSVEKTRATDEDGVVGPAAVRVNTTYDAPEPVREGPTQATPSTASTKRPLLSTQTQPNGILSEPTPAETSTAQAGSNSAPPQKPPEPPADEKASVILQLNAELLKVCMEFQNRQMMQSLEFNSYATRLQSNLTWLASAADRQRHHQTSLPIMSPPTSVPWSSTQIINDFYQRLPTIFAKDIAKRQREAAQANAAGVKRGPDPTDDNNGMRKRLDTGERRLSSLGSGSGSSPPHIRSPSVLSNGTVTSSSGMNVGANIPDPQTQGVQGMTMGMVPPQQTTPQPRVSPESTQPPNQPVSFQNTEAQMRDRQRMMQLRQSQQAMVPKDAQRMPPPSMPNGVPNPMAHGGSATAGPSNNPQMMQAILTTFGQQGLQNYKAILQGPGHPFVSYMINHVQGFAQLPLHAQLQKMHVVQNNVQNAQAQQHQQQRAAAAVAAANGLNGVNPQVVGDAASPFGRHSGSPPNVGAPHLQSHPTQQIQQSQPQMPTSQQSTNPPYPSSGMGLGMPPNMQAQRPVNSGPPPQGMGPQSMGAASGLGVPPGINLNNLTPQQRQLFLMQQQMHQRGNDGVMNPQQAYAAAQEKMRQEQQSRMSNHQQHSPPHNVGSPPNPGALGGMGVPGMPGIARSARSPTDGGPVTPRMPQKRPGQQNDTYHMALYNQAQAQRQASLSLRPGTAMSMNPAQQQQQMSQYGINGGTINPGMMYTGGAEMSAHPTAQQTWQPTTPQQQQQPPQQPPLPQQQPFHSVSPAALQHHPDSGTPRPQSSASNNAMAPDAMGDSFDSLFNWSGT